MRHPFQCIATCLPKERTDGILLAACAAELYTLCLGTNAILSKWTSQSSQTACHETLASEEPPGKKRKLAEVNSRAPRIIKLVCAADASHVIAVTEDKYVRVFRLHGSSGQLEELSQREMPKRPCGVALTGDQQTILSADKFGDVYGLPLVPDPEKEASSTSTRNSSKEPKKTFTPAASELTVHSKRNLEALNQQRKGHPNPAKSKEGPTFEHELLLGHVSMLTDLIVASGEPPQDPTKRAREYIITADRDEHVRVSRGIPQTSVIEGFCHGHDQFVNKLCLATRDILVSGGGDDHLFVWQWEDQTLINKIDLKSRALGDSNANIAVTGMCRFPTEKGSSEMFVAICQGVPALHFIPCEDLRRPDAQDQMTRCSLESNPLDVVVDESSLIVSVDNCTLPGSTSEPRPEAEARLWRISMDLSSGEPCWKTEVLDVGDVGEDVEDLKRLQSTLYSSENLRKRGDEDQGE